jgi:uncharacterized protein YndB with AHSA1/START domain
VPPYYQSTHSLSIQASPEKIYEALTDWVARGAWRPGIQITWEENPKAFLNQKVVFRIQGLFPYSFSYRVAGLEPPHRLYMEYMGKPLRGRSAVEITPEEGGSRVAFHWMKVEPVGFWARLYFACGLGTRSHADRTRETLRMLKDYLEKISPKT